MKIWTQSAAPPLFSQTLTRSILGRDRLTWDHLAYIRKLWPGKVVLKGVLSTSDALQAHRLGLDGIIVSSHGGRQLDFCVAPLDILPEIRTAVPDLVVMIDGGIRRGTDVLKALARGADYVFVGRPVLCAAAVGGEDGVRHAIRLLQTEILLNMALLGINTIDDVTNLRLIPSSRAISDSTKYNMA